VHPKGAVYFVETITDFFSGAQFARLTELDEATGTLVNAIALPNSTTQLTNNECINGNNQTSSFPPQVGPPMVDEAGTVRLQVAVTQYAADGSVCGHQAISSSTTLSLLQVPLSGASGFVTVQTLGAGGFDVVDIPTAVPAETIPDGAGGVLAGWTYTTSGSSTLETRVSRLSPAGNAQYTLPFAGGWFFPNESMVLGENGVAFATDSQQVVSFDLVSGSLRWVWQSAAGMIRLNASLSDGGLAALDSGSHVVLISANGVESQTQVDLIGAQYHSVGIWKGQLHDGNLAMMMAPILIRRFQSGLLLKAVVRPLEAEKFPSSRCLFLLIQATAVARLVC